MIVILLLISMISVMDSRLSITSHTPTGTVMKSGSTSSLSCNSSSPWFLCIWEGPRGLACQCQTLDGGVSSMCAGHHRFTLSGRETSCVMNVVGVEEGDAGMYKCVLADRQEIVTVHRTMQVGVGVMSTVEWTGRGQLVEVSEGEEVELECRATEGFPRPQITIEGLNYLSRKDVSLSLTSIAQSITYIGRYEDNNTDITCTSVQKDEFGTVLYTSIASIRLRVALAPKFIAASVFPFWIYIVIGVGALLLLALLLLLIFCCCKKKKKDAAVIVDGQDRLVPVHTEVTAGQHSSEYRFDAHGKIRRNNSFNQALNKPFISPSQAPFTATYASLKGNKSQSSVSGQSGATYASVQKGKSQSSVSGQSGQSGQGGQNQFYLGGQNGRSQSYVSGQNALHNQSYFNSQKDQSQSYFNSQKDQSQSYTGVQKTDKTDNKRIKTTSSPIDSGLKDQYIGKTSVLNLDSFHETHTGISNSSYISSTLDNATSKSNNATLKSNANLTALCNNSNFTALSNNSNVTALSNNSNVTALSGNANITHLSSKADISGISSQPNNTGNSSYTNMTGLSSNADITGISSDASNHLTTLVDDYNASNHLTTIVDEYNFKQTTSTVTERAVTFSGSKLENEDKYVTENYLLNQYKLKDCDPIDPKYKSYSDIIKQHLIHNPTVEVEQSLVEVKKKTFHADSVKVDYSLSYS